MVVGYGRSLPKGCLPVFSVDTEEEARRLLVLACPTNTEGQFIAPEVAAEQTLDNLALFSDRLKRAWDILANLKTKRELDGRNTEHAG